MPGFLFLPSLQSPTPHLHSKHRVEAPTSRYWPACPPGGFFIAFDSKKAPKPPALPTDYELVGLHIQKVINSPSAQKLKSATVSSLPEESLEHWYGVLEEFGEVDSVTLEFMDDGRAEISWVNPDED